MLCFQLLILIDFNHLNLRDTLVFVTGILHTFGNNISNRRMSGSSIGIGIGDGNIIWVW